MNAIVIRTQNSEYLFDGHGNYLRRPRTERNGRERLWQALSPSLADEVWMPVARVELRTHPAWGEQVVLGIIYPQADLDRYPEGFGEGVTTTPILPEDARKAWDLVEHEQWHGQNDGTTGHWSSSGMPIEGAG